MKKATFIIRILLSVFIILVTINVYATTQIATTPISEDTWSTDTVIVNNDLIVNGYLNINPGTLVLFNGYYSITIGAGGNINANGTKAEPIIFRPKDGNAAIGWGGIRFTAPSYTEFSNFTNCEFQYAKTNSEQPNGGVLTIYNHNKIAIDSCVFKNNYAEQDGGAIYLDKSNVTITNCMFTKNNAETNGATICLINNSSIKFIQNIVVNNDGPNQIVCFDTDSTQHIYYNTIANNNGHPIFIGNTYKFLIKGNIFSNNTLSFWFDANDIGHMSYNCITDGMWKVQSHQIADFTYKNNIVINPQFTASTANPGSGEDGSTADWSLLPESFCINAGTTDTINMFLPTTDYNGNPRIYNGTYYRTDIGAIEYQGNSASPQLVFDCDFNQNTNNYGLNANQTGTPQSSTVYINSRFENIQAMEFMGDTQSVTFNGFTAIQSTDNFTVSMWVNPYKMMLDEEYIILLQENSWQVSLINNKLVFSYWTGSTQTTFESQPVFYTNAWQFAAIVYDGINVTFYKNYDLIDQIAASGTVDNASQLIVSSNYTGALSDIKIYNKAISDTEIDLLRENYGKNAEPWKNTTEVTFKVNMAYHIQQGLFNPDDEWVDLAGEFNDWGGSGQMNDDDGNGIYEITIDNLQIGHQYEFKFRANGSWTGIHDFPESGNRLIAIENSPHSFLACMNDECVDFDIAPVALVAPVNGTLTASETITIEFKNMGSNTINETYIVSYNVNGTGWVQEATTQISLSIGQTESYSFTATYDFSASKKYNIEITASAATDNYNANDTIQCKITSIPIITTFPNTEDFEGDDYWMVNGKNPSWQVGIPANNVIDAAFSGSNACVTNLTGNHNNNEYSYVYSPYYNFTGIQMGVKMKIFRHCSENTGAYLEIYNSNTGKWAEVPKADSISSFNQPDYDIEKTDKKVWSGFYDEWEETTFFLDTITGTVQFRIVFVSNETTDEGFAFDDFEIFEWITNDPQITDVWPKTSPWLTNPEIIGGTIINLGDSIISHVYLKSSLDDGNTNGTSNLAMLTSVNVDTWDNLNYSIEGTSNTFSIWAYDLDNTVSSDTVTHSATKLKTINSYPYFENFDAPAAATIDSSWYMRNKTYDKNPIWERTNNASQAYSGKYFFTTGNNTPLHFKTTAYLESPGFELNDMQMPTVSFYIKRNFTNETNYATILTSTSPNTWEIPIANNTINWPSYNQYIDDIGDGPTWTKVVDDEWVFVRAQLPDLAYTGQVQFAIMVHGGNNWNGDTGLLIDDFKLEESPAKDLAVIDLINPVGQSGLGLESIITKVQNQGLIDDITSFNISYSVNGAEFVHDFGVSQTIEPDSTYTHTFATQYDFSAVGIYKIKIAVECGGDGFSMNDTAEYTITNQLIVADFPYFDDFEGTNLIIVAGQNPSWQLGTPNGQVINHAHSGNNVYMTNLAGNYNANELSYIELPILNLSAVNYPILNFNYWVQTDKTAAASIEASTDGGETWENICWNHVPFSDACYDMEPYQNSYTPGLNGQYAQWRKAMVNLPYANIDNVRIRIYFTTSPDAILGLDGIAIDDIRIYDGSSADLEILKISQHLTVDLTSDFSSLYFDIFNHGNTNADNYQIYVVVDGVDTVVMDYSGNSICPNCHSGIYNNIGLNLSAQGPHTLKAWIRVTGDINNTNDTISKTIINAPGILVEGSIMFDMEGVTEWAPLIHHDNLYASWQHGTPDASSTITSSGKIWKTGLGSEGGFREKSYLYSPGFSLENIQFPIIEFDMWRDLGVEQAVNLQYFKDGEWWNIGVIGEPDNWYTVYAQGHEDLLNNMEPFNGANEGWTNITDAGWVHAKHVIGDLGGYNGTQFRFAYNSRENWTGGQGFAFDNFEISNYQPATDVSVIEVLAPTSGLVNDTDTVKFMVKNNGTTVINSIYASIRLFGEEVFLDTVNALALQPNEERLIVLNQTIELLENKEYDLEVNVTCPDDEIPQNNYMNSYFVKLIALTLNHATGYTDSFESNVDWVATGENSSWQMGVPAAAVINAASDGSQAWVTNLIGNCNQELSQVLSPVFDFSDIRLPKISFDKWSQTNPGSGLSFQYSLNMGENWVTVRQGENWHNVHDLYDLWGNFSARDGWNGMDTEWNTSTTIIPEIGLEESVLFRFIFTSMSEPEGTEGFAIDNFKIDEVAGDYNAAVLWIERERTVCSGDMQDITVKVTNIGYQPINNFDVILDIPGQNFDTVKVTTVLNALDTIDVVFNNISFPTAMYKDTINFMAYTDLANDDLLDNDTAFSYVWTYNSDYIDMPGWQSLNVCQGYYNVGVFSIDQDIYGNIWYATMRGGVIKKSINNLEVFGETGVDGDYSWALAAAPDGKVWWSSALRPEIMMYENGEMQVLKPVPDVVFDEYIYPATNGDVWFSNYQGVDLLKFDGTTWTHITDFVGLGKSMAAIGELPNGNILFSFYNEVFEYNGTTFEPFTIPAETNMYEIYFDTVNNETWFGGYGTLHVYNGTNWTDYSTNITGAIQDIDIDRYGNLWAVSSNKTAYKFDGTNWQTFTPADGMVNASLYSVCGLADGRVAMGSFGGGISIYANGLLSDFDFEVNNDTVSFTDKSIGNSLTYMYNFDDGKVSTQANPTHIYNTQGIYNVCLTVKDDRQYTSTNCHEVLIGDTAQSMCQALFEYQVFDDSVEFSNLSSNNITNYFWSFGDNESSNEFEPYHKYSEGGFYEVVLSVEDTVIGCVDEYISTIEIIGAETTCKAEFGYEANGTEVTFYNNSLGEITDYLWSFGDGKYSSDTTPTHTYDVGGIYDVCLTVYNSANDCMDELCFEVLVDEENVVTCQAGFTFMVNENKVSFTSNVTNNITDYLWKFDDNQYSDSINPVHLYETPGFYRVELTVFDSNSNCINSVNKMVIVTAVGETICHAEFAYFVDDATAIFTNASSGTFTEVLWSFGDGEYSTQIEPTHEYSEPDFYEVCLSIYDTISGCMDEYCNVVPITDVNTAICDASFDYYAKSLEVSFTGKSMGIVTNYFWDFGDGYYSYDSVTVHNYDKPGYYEVSFTIFNDTNNCMDEAYEVIMIIDTTKAMCNAAFEYYANEKEVSFSNTSQGIFTNYFWNFGDGNYSTDSNTVNTYDDPGYYEVELTVFNDTTDCLDTYYVMISVIDTTVEICRAGFSYYTEDKTVYFNDESMGKTTDYFWDFGDGNYSIDTNAVNTYEGEGYFEVTQTIYNDNTGCLDEITKVIVVIDTTKTMCNARFSYYPEEFTVSFTSEAVGDFKQLLWDFDDGTNSNQLNPVHVYENPGYYDVSFTVVDTATECFDTKYKVIFVEGDTQQDYGEVSAAFSYFPANDSLTVFFTDNSLGTVVDWYWDFGDNSVASLDTSPIYQYAANDYYRVCQTVQNPENQNTKCKFIAIGDVSTKNTAFFAYYADSTTATAYFQNKSLGDIESYYWDFGDIVTSEQKNPSHTYADTGYYAVCLSTTSSVGRVRSYCKDVRIGNAIDNPCLFSCVWPGDANSDLEANHYDIMTIGLNYGMEGPARESATINWYGQTAQNWSTYQLDSTNNKHGDCNGDGVINSDDTLAIVQNFAYSHYWQPDVKNPEWLIACVWVNEDDEKAVGSRSKAKAILAPPSKKEKADDIYAIGYEIEVIGGEKIKWDSVVVSFEGSWLGVNGVNMLTVAEMDTNQYIIYIGQTRIDKQNTTGSGMIAEISFKFKDDVDETGVSFNVTTLGGILSNGDNVSVDGSILLALNSPINICVGETAIIDAGSGFDTYTWSTGATDTSRIEVSEAGFYYVTVTDDTGASASDTVEVIVNELPIVDLGDDITQSDSIMLDAGAEFETYLWSTGSDEQSIIVSESGEYSVMVSNIAGCFGYDTINVTITGIVENLANKFTIFPNPNGGKFWLVNEFNSDLPFIIEIISIEGKTVWQKEIDNSSIKKCLINTGNIEKGLYSLKVIHDGKIGVLRFVIK